MSEELRTSKAIWFCSSCMGFKDHTNFEKISDSLFSGECSCGKKNMNYFTNKPRNELFGMGSIDILREDGKDG